MAKINRKRFSLGCVIDRLHVENAISSKKHNLRNREQVGFENFVNPAILQNKRREEEVITVTPDALNKVKHQVCTRSKNVQSKQSEGGSVACELCGQRSFTVYPKTVEIKGNSGKLAQVTKTVCRKCYAPAGSACKSKEKDKSKSRPYYEPPLIGIVGDRASQSWHFIRRDYIGRKRNELHNHRCNENEYSEKYLSSASSDENNLSECEDDSDDDEDVVYSSDEEVLYKNRFSSQNSNYQTNNKSSLSSGENDIPEIQRQGHSYINDLRNHKGYEDHLALRNEQSCDFDQITYANTTILPTITAKNDDGGDDNVDNDNDDGNNDHKTLSTFINRPDELGKIGHLLSDNNRSFRGVDLALAVSQDENCSTVALPINVELSPTDHSHYCYPTVDIINGVDYNNINSASSSLCTYVTKGVHNVSGTSEDEYVEVECVDDDNIEHKLLEDIDLALEIKFVDSEPKYLLTQLLTPSIHRNSMDNGLYDCFDNKPVRFRLLKNVYNKNVIKPKDITENKSNASYHKGVCRLVTVVNRKKSHYKDGSSNSSFYDSKGIYCKKQDLPSFIQLDDRKSHKKKTYASRKKEIDSFLLKYNPSSPPPPSPVGVINSVISDIDRNLTLKELQQKFWPRSVSGCIFTDENEQIPGAPKGNVCGICSQSIKCYSSYNRNNAPPKVLPYFKDTENKIRACKACLLKLYENTAGPSGTGGTDVIITGSKRAPQRRKEVPVPSKIRKLVEGKFRILPKIRRFSRFLDTPMFTSRVVAPKVNRIYDRNAMYNSIVQNHTRVLVDSIPAGTITLNDEIGKILIRNSSPQSPLGISSFGRLNLKVVQNPNENQIKSIAQNCRTKYVIVQTAPNSGESKVQKLSTDKNSGKVLSGETKLGSHGDITINGQKYKIDTEFKLNDLVKDNENAFLSAETQKDLLTRLPSILKRTANSKAGIPTHFKIVNVGESTLASIGTSVSSPKSLSSPSHTQFIVQSIAPVLTNPSIFSSAADCSIISAKKIQTIAPAPPKIISHVKGSTFQSTVTEYPVNPVKKLQSIAPAPPKVAAHVNSSISSSYVADCSIIGAKNVVSHIDTAVYPRVTNGSVIGAKRHNVLLPASKLDTVVYDTSTNVGNCSIIGSNKHAKILPSLKPDPVIIDFKPKNHVKNLVEIRLPENTVHRPARKIILNSPADSIKYIPSGQSDTSCVIPNLPSSLSESVSDSKVSITTSINPGSPPVKSFHGIKTAIFTNQKFTSPISLSGLKSSTATTTIVNACLNRSISEMKASITRNSDTVSPTLVKCINTSASTKMSASSSSLVKSINELRASLNTYSNASPPSFVNPVSRTTAITINNNTTASLMVKSVNNMNASITTNSNATSISLGKPVSNLKTSMTAISNATPPSLSALKSAITIKNNTKPLVKTVSDLNSSITSNNYATSPSSVKSVSNLKVSMTTNSNAASGKSVNDVTSSSTTNSLLSSISRQIQQQIIKTSSVVPSKSHIVKPSPQSSILSTISSPTKVSIENQSGDKMKLDKPTSSNQVLELNNGIKIVGTYLNTEGMKPRMAIAGKITPPIRVSMSNQANPSVISQNK